MGLRNISWGSSVLSLLVLQTGCQVQGYYDGESLGPARWHEEYPDCGGLMQSPVDIISEEVIYDKVLQPFDMADYESSEYLDVKNKERHSLKLDYNGPDIEVKGGSLPDKYILTQIHFHWGEADHYGSEHTVDGTGYPMEMHLVHHLWHQNKGNASEHPFGLAVIGYFIEVQDGAADNVAFEELLEKLKSIDGPKSKAKVPFAKLRAILPTSRHHHYHRYWGSLTTPPCSETVIWSVATRHIFISKTQLDEFKAFLHKMNQLMSNNYRPPQKLNYRHVFSSDPKYVPLLGSGPVECKTNSSSAHHPARWSFIIFVISLVVSTLGGYKL